MSRRLESIDDQGQKWTTPYPNAEQRAALRASRSVSRAGRTELQQSACSVPGDVSTVSTVAVPTTSPSPPPSNPINLSLDSEQDFPSLPRSPTASPNPETQTSRIRVPVTSAPLAHPLVVLPAPLATAEDIHTASPAPTLSQIPLPDPPAALTTPSLSSPAAATALAQPDQLLPPAPYPMDHVAAPQLRTGPIAASPLGPDHAGPSSRPPAPTPGPTPPALPILSVQSSQLSPPATHTRKRRRAASDVSTIVFDLAAFNGHVESPRPIAARPLTPFSISDDEEMNVDLPPPGPRPPNVAWPPPPAHLPRPLHSPPPYQARASTPAPLAPAFRQHGAAAKIYTSSPWQAWLRLNPAQERFWQRALAPGEPGNVLFAVEYSRSETSGSSSADRIAAELSAALQRSDDHPVAVSYPHPVLTPSGLPATRQSVWHFVYDLTAAEQKALLRARAISRDGRAYLFLPGRLDTSQPVFLYALQGLRGTLIDLDPHLRGCVYESTAYQELCAAYTDHPRMEDFLRNLRFDRLSMRDSNGRPTQVIRVYAHLPTDDPTEQQSARDSLRTVNFDHQYLGVARKETYLCNHCQGSDHPSGLCPLPNIHGWQGPNPNASPATEPDPVDLPPAVLPAAPQSLLANPERDRGRGQNRGRGGGRGRGRGRGRPGANGRGGVGVNARG
ncbi:hypothetical protein K488DRAFT_91468 [Vararia minispora EC-137]|uniref:Uncharacterized protein n=1 Tax=Vararia minispora EC-137 TaxID=1314806 RepID=A0ACB8Q6M0_9AGAM|nr:hypothetical protein K488DRAFT_91468 [Vararia minispora EC-137]